MSDETLDILANVGFQQARERQPLPVERPPAPPPVLAVAEVECHDGASIWRRETATTVGTPTGTIVRIESEDVLESFDPRHYEPVQPARIPVLHRHDRKRTVGRVVHLEWRPGEPARIVAVMLIDPAEAEAWEGRDTFVSPGTRRIARRRIELDHLALCEGTARIAAAPVKWSDTTFERRSTWTRQTTPGFDVLRRAYAALRTRPTGAPIPIVGFPEHDEPLEEHRAQPSMPPYMRRNGDNGLFYSGGGGRVLDVS